MGEIKSFMCIPAKVQEIGSSNPCGSSSEATGLEAIG
jgi:hypothetical protein